MKTNRKILSLIVLAILALGSVSMANAQLVLDPIEREYLDIDSDIDVYPRHSRRSVDVDRKDIDVNKKNIDVNKKRVNVNKKTIDTNKEVSADRNTTISNSTVTINSNSGKLSNDRNHINDRSFNSRRNNLKYRNQLKYKYNSEGYYIDEDNIRHYIYDDPYFFYDEGFHGKVHVDGVRTRPLTTADRLRRERIRQELKNEDLLQQKIEQSRLEQELERTDTILNDKSPVGLKDQYHYYYDDELGEFYYVDADDKRVFYKKERTLEQKIKRDERKLEKNDILGSFVTLRPKVGMAFFRAEGPFEVNPRGSFGVEVGLEFTQNLSFDLGYSFNQYGIQAPNSFGGPFAWYGAFNRRFFGPGNARNQDDLRMNQNVFEAGIRFNVTKKSSRLRPYFTAGGAYTHSFVNYPEEFRRNAAQFTYFRDDWAQDYELSTFSGYAGIGLDITLGKAVSIGFQGKYYHPLTTNEQGYINGYSFFYPQAGFQNLWNYSNAFFGDPASFGDKQQVASQLGYSGFYTMQFLMTFNF